MESPDVWSRPYGAPNYRLKQEQWRRLEVLNNQAARVITRRPLLASLEKLSEHARLNMMQKVAAIRAAATVHWKGLKLPWAGRAILDLRRPSPDDPLPPHPEPQPPWVVAHCASRGESSPSQRKPDELRETGALHSQPGLKGSRWEGPPREARRLGRRCVLHPHRAAPRCRRRSPSDQPLCWFIQGG